VLASLLAGPIAIVGCAAHSEYRVPDPHDSACDYWNGEQPYYRSGKLKRIGAIAASANATAMISIIALGLRAACVSGSLREQKKPGALRILVRLASRRAGPGWTG